MSYCVFSGPTEQRSALLQIDSPSLIASFKSLNERQLDLKFKVAEF